MCNILPLTEAVSKYKLFEGLKNNGQESYTQNRIEKVRTIPRVAYN